MNIENLLIEALKKAKAEEATSRNTALPKEIAAILTKHYKSKDMLLKTQGILKSKAPEPAASTSSEWKDWEGPSSSSKKSTNVAKASTKKEIAVDNSDDDNDQDEVSLEELVNMNDQQMLDHFGTIPKMREFAKDLGFPTNPDESAKEFMESFREQLIFSIDEATDEEE